MAKSKNTYRITLVNWAEHNPGHKKSFKKILIPTSFCTDSKLLQMSISERWFYLGLITSCGAEAKDTITLSEPYLKVLCTSGVGIDNLLDSLQSFQLLTYEKNPCIKEGKKEGIEEKVAVSKLPAKDFQNISNPTELQNVALTKSAEFLELDKIFGSEHAFGPDFPPALRRGKTNFYSRILISYDFNMTDIRRDMNSIINEGLLEKIPTASKSDYIATRVKKKALEVYNATR